MSGATTELREAVKRAIEWHGPQAGIVVMRVVLEELVASGFDPASIIQGSLEHGASKVGPLVIRHLLNAAKARWGAR